VKLSNKHKKTLAAIFEAPTPKNLKFASVKSLLNALGATIEERKPSHFSVELNGVRRVQVRPHPGNEMPAYYVEKMRQFLAAAGVEPP